MEQRPVIPTVPCPNSLSTGSHRHYLNGCFKPLNIGVVCYAGIISRTPCYLLTVLAFPKIAPPPRSRWPSVEDSYTTGTTRSEIAKDGTRLLNYFECYLEWLNLPEEFRRCLSLYSILPVQWFSRLNKCGI